MTELTELIKRLSSFYGLEIEDRRDDYFWDGTDFEKEGVAIFLIQKGNEFFWSSNETEDAFLEQIGEMFYEKGKESVSYY